MGQRSPRPRRCRSSDPRGCTKTGTTIDDLPGAARSGSVGPVARRTALALCAAILGAGPAAAQQVATDPAIAEKVEVDVVDVPVIVTDAEGNPIRGLTVADFTVQENGKKVPISNFAEVAGRLDSPAARQAAGVAEGVPDGRTDPFGLNLVVFVDRTNLHPLRRNQALDALSRYLAEGAADVPVMIVAAGTEVEVVQPFTTDRALVRDRLESLRGGSQPGIFTASNETELLTEIENGARAVLDCLSAQCDTGIAANLVQATVSNIRETSRVLSRQSEIAVEGLRVVVAGLSRMPGPKAVLYLSDGFSLDAGAGLIREFRARIERATDQAAGGVTLGSSTGGSTDETAQARHEAIRRAVLAAIDGSYTDTNAFSLVDELRELTAEAATDRIRIYSVQAEAPDSGVLGADVPSARGKLEQAGVTSAMRQGNLRAPLDIMTDATGGLVLQGNLRMADAVDRVLGDSTAYYSIGFRMPNGADGKYRKLKVKVKARGARVRAPQGYVAKTPQDRRRDAVLTALMAAEPDNPDGIALQFAEPTVDAGGRTIVNTTVLVPISEMQLSARGGNHATALKLFVAAQTENGRFSLTREYPVDVRIPSQHVEAARAQSFPIRLDLAMAPGVNRIVVGVWDDQGPLRSFARGTVAAE